MIKKKFLITGFCGFVARHFIEYLYTNNIKSEVYGLDIQEPQYNFDKYKSIISIKYKNVDLLNLDGLREVFIEFTPDYILHLASFSSVAYSWQNPSISFTNNTNIFLNLVMVAKDFNSKCRILSIGSSEEYGDVTREDLPLKEVQVLKPVSPYAVARVSQEMLSKVFVDSYHLDIVLTRSFNHIGPWQDDRFVVPSFIKRIIQIKKEGNLKGVIEVGDISIVRDFIDVRDVVNAYYLLLMNGRSGEVYNICSGKGITLEEIINIIALKVGVEVTTVINPQYIRPSDNKFIVGSNYKLKDELSWKLNYRLDQTIADMLEEVFI